MSDEMTALAMFFLMLLLLLTGQRIFVVIGAIASLFAFFQWGPGGVEIPFNASITLLNWYPLLTLPMFIYLGYMLSESGIADELYDMFHVFMGSIHGGLALGTLGLMVGIAAMNGLSVAGMSIGASIAVPELLKRNYDKRMISGVIQAGSSLGIMVPPSVVLVLYGMIARVPVGQLWLAGLIPGLMLAAMFMLYVLIRCRLQPSLGPPLPAEEREQMTLAQKLRLLRAGVLPLVIIFTMTGLFIMGVTSLVESSAVGAGLATAVTAVRGRLTRQVVHDTVRKTLTVSCMFMWVIMAALGFSAVFDGLGAGDALQNVFIERWDLHPWAVLIMMQVSFLIMGMFLDDTAMLVLVAPLYIPLVITLGFDPVWFGVLYTVTVQIAYMTPPFGYNLFLMRAMSPPEITLGDIYRSIVPFVLVMLFGLAVIMIFPQIALWLPELVYR